MAAATCLKALRLTLHDGYANARIDGGDTEERTFLFSQIVDRLPRRRDEN